MAKIKYSALVSDMRGKLNGSVASKNRFGSYYRNKVTPVNPQTVYQQNARQRFGALSSQFKSLTNAQVSAWNEAAQNFPFTNIFGDQVFLTGQMLFNKLNGNLLKVGQETIEVAPSPASFPEFIASGAAAVSSTGVIVVSIIGLETQPSGYSVVAYATRPVPVTRNFLKNEYRQVEGEIDWSDGDVDITEGYFLRFGNFSPGQKIGIRLALVNNENGQQSVPLEVVVVSS